MNSHQRRIEKRRLMRTAHAMGLQVKPWWSNYGIWLKIDRARREAQHRARSQQLELV